MMSEKNVKIHIYVGVSIYKSSPRNNKLESDSWAPVSY